MTTLTRTLPVRHKNDPCCTPIAAPRLTETQTVLLADRLKALADPTRLRLPAVLVQNGAPLCVCDLTPGFAQHQPTISHHLKLLRDAGLIAAEKQGIWAYYGATDDGRKALALIQTLA